MSRRGAVARALAAACALACAAGCSALLDWNDFTGGAGDDGGPVGDATFAEGAAEGGDGGGGDDAGDDGPKPPSHCGSGMQCVTAPPSGWTGPVALFVADAGAAPACGTGFSANPAFDGQGGLTAGASTCTPCSCGAASGVTCAGPVMTFYVDDTCNGSLGSTLTVTSSCQATPLGSFGVTVAAPQPTGGGCAPSGGTASTPALSWAQVARACSPSVPVGPADCDAGQVCATPPAAPFGASGCVMQAGVASACPAEYPSGPQVFYSGVNDQRGCAACQCAAPVGGTCSIGSPAVTACTPPGGSWNAPGACTGITGPEPVKLAATPALDDAGSCSASGGTPSGAATGTGATSFCCAP